MEQSAIPASTPKSWDCIPAYGPIDTTFVFKKDNSGVVRFVTGIPAKR